jgi:hypothetical protein
LGYPDHSKKGGSEIYEERCLSLVAVGREDGLINHQGL